MKPEEFIKEKYGHDSGMKVPEGYFQSLEKGILESLPPYKAAPKALNMTRWQRVKPYVYLAAMFCGIWLMMKVFHSVSQPMYSTLDNPPSALVHLLDDESEDGLQISYNLPEYEIEEDVIMNYDSIEDFEKDFGYSLSPEYASISVPNESPKKV